MGRRPAARVSLPDRVSDVQLAGADGVRLAGATAVAASAKPATARSTQAATLTLAIYQRCRASSGRSARRASAPLRSFATIANVVVAGNQAQRKAFSATSGDPWRI